MLGKHQWSYNVIITYMFLFLTKISRHEILCGIYGVKKKKKIPSTPLKWYIIYYTHMYVYNADLDVDMFQSF